MKREELIMKRRGLNFISDQVVETINDDQLVALENEVDNVAPKIVGILALNSACDITTLRHEMIHYCNEYAINVLKKKTDDDESQFKAFICPNPGSSTNMGSRKQRLMFLEINRKDPYHVLEVGKVADLVVVVMSCKDTETTGLKIDPDKYSHAIDETGYKALGLLRSQGIP